MTVTIKQVAEQAGVATSTVSRVIADHPSISNKTKQKVRQVMADLHYIPNSSAQSLARSHAEAIGIILPEASDAFYQNPFFPTVLRGINEAITEHNYAMQLSSGHDTEAHRANLQKMILGHQVDGLIFLYAKEDDPLLDFTIKQNFPVVVIGSPSDISIPNVDNDNRQIAKELTEYLIQNGSQRPLYIGGDQTQQFVKQRLQGFKEALLEQQLDFSDDQVSLDNAFLPSAGYALAEHLLQTNANFDSFIVIDQLIARGMRTYYLKQHHALPPLATFKAYDSSDTLMGSNECYINLDSQSLGSESVNLLFDILNCPDNETIENIHRILPATLITPGT